MGESSRGLLGDDFLSLDGVKVMASNVTDRIRRLQQTLQTPPPPATAPGGSPAVSGYLYMQKPTGEWKKLWCAFADGEVSYRRDVTSKTVMGRIAVSFCEADFFEHESSQETKSAGPPPQPALPKAQSFLASGPASFHFSSPSPRASLPLPPVVSSVVPSVVSMTTRVSVSEDTRLSTTESKTTDDLPQVSMLGSQARHTFKIFSPARTYMFRADSEMIRDEFCSAIFNWLKQHLDESDYGRKLEALKEVNPVIREQFLIHDTHYAQLAQTLARSSFMEDELPITSTRKEKCGVLSMEIEGSEWKDFYFVLFDGVLYYYKDSKSTEPTGFLALKYASVDLDPIGLTKGDFKFEVKTPLRTVACRARHAVALAEWIASLDGALNAHLKKGKVVTKKTSMDVLNDINRLIANVATFRTLNGFPACLTLFKEFIGQQAAIQLDFVLAVDRLKDPKLTNFERQAQSSAVYRQFFGTDQKCSLGLPTAIEPSRQLPYSEEMFEEAAHCCEKHLDAAFAAFKETNMFRSMSYFGEPPAGGPTAHRRNVQFDATMVQSFLLKTKGSKKSAEIKLSPKKGVLTIGRDKSNNLVVEDSRVSRSHARVEYSDTQCEYIDLGSSCGSKLNGKPVLRVKLQPGDVIEIGQSTLIFQVGKRSRFSFLGIP